MESLSPQVGKTLKVILHLSTFCDRRFTPSRGRALHLTERWQLERSSSHWVQLFVGPSNHSTSGVGCVGGTGTQGHTVRRSQVYRKCKNNNETNWKLLCLCLSTSLAILNIISGKTLLGKSFCWSSSKPLLWLLLGFNNNDLYIINLHLAHSDCLSFDKHCALQGTKNLQKFQ